MPEIDASYHDPRISMEYWWPRLSKLDVPTPETELIDITHDEETDGFPLSWETDEIIDAMESFPTDRAFVRTDRKSASILEEGSFLHAPKKDHIDLTVLKLLDMSMMGDLPFNSIAVREWLDVDAYAEGYGAPIGPEVRFFIDEGEVLCSHLRTTPEDFDTSVDDPTDILVEMGAAHMSAEKELREYAQMIADEFNESGWSVDFLQTEDGSWYCTDMAIYGLYYFDMDDDESKWKSISYHEPGCEHNLETNPPDHLPEHPENARTGRLDGR